MLLTTLKSLARHRAFSIPSILMLAGGTAIASICFAVLESAVLNAVPYGSPTRLVQAMKSQRSAGDAFWRLTRADFELLRERSRSFESLGYESAVPGSIAGLPIGQAGAMIAKVSPGFLDTLRIKPGLGRLFRPEDFEPASQGAVLLSAHFWTSAFSADPEVLGKVVTLQGARYTVIGVAPKAIRRPVNVADVWIPDTATATAADSASAGDKQVVARLREGITIEDARREIEGLKPAPMKGFQESYADRFALLSLVDQLVGATGSILNLLLGACLLVQLLACLNVGHLLLARRMGKAQELGIHMALGCSRERLCFNLLIEAVSVALPAALAALLIVWLMLPVATTVTSMAIGVETNAAISAQVLAFAIGLGLLSSVVCAVVPAVLVLRLDAALLMHERWRMSDLAFSASRLQDILVVAQVAAAVFVLSGFGLLAKSVYRLSAVNLGFKAEGLSYSMFDSGKLEFPASMHKLDEALLRIARLPAVESAAIGSTPVLTGASMKLSVAALTDAREWARVPPVHLQSVSEDYFATMGIALLEGRSFNRSDIKGSPCVVIVNRSFARLAWPKIGASGRYVDLNGGAGGERSPCEIVGVVSDARDVQLALPPEPALFFPHLQRPASGQATIITRSASVDLPVESIRKIVAEADPTRQWNFSTNLGELISTAIRPSTTRAKLLGGLAGLALLLALSGMYAAASFRFSQQAKDFGVRIALGASAKQLTVLIYSHYARLAVTGGLAGAAAGVALGRGFSAGLSLFQAEAFDFTVFAAAPLVCIVVVLGAIAAPTRRATTANPILLLRSE